MNRTLATRLQLLTPCMLMTAQDKGACHTATVHMTQQMALMSVIRGRLRTGRSIMLDSCRRPMLLGLGA